MAIIFVQNVTRVSPSAATTQATTITSSTAGNLLAICCNGYTVGASTKTVTSVTDNLGQTWVQVPSARSTMSTYYFNDIWYFPNTAAGVTSVTITLSSSTKCDTSVYEFSGVKTISPVDVSGATSNAAPAAAAKSTALTTAASGDVIIAMMNNDNTITSVNSPYSGVFYDGFSSAYNIIYHAKGGLI